MLQAPVSALIVGGGIAGLTLAAFLRRQGVECSLVERAESWRPVGAGIVLASNAMRVLRELGCEAELLAAGREVRRVELTDWRGRVLAATDLAVYREPHGPSVALHRAELHRVLLAAARPPSLRLGATVTEVRPLQDRVEVEVADSRGASEECYDLLFGADGLRSQVRTLVFGETPIRYAGYTCWRLLVKRDFGIDRACEMWGPGRRFGVVPIGGRRLYCYSTLNAPAGSEEAAAIDRRAFCDLFGSFGGPVPAVLSALDDPLELIHNDLEDLSLPHWTAGRVALLGDAAHAFTPNLGQGAAMAIEDAWVVSEELGRASDPAIALSAYETRRRQRVQRIRDLSWRFGRLAQWQSPLACWCRNALVRALPNRLAAESLRRLLSERV